MPGGVHPSALGLKHAGMHSSVKSLLMSTLVSESQARMADLAGKA